MWYLVHTPDGIVMVTWILYYLSEVVVLKLTSAVYIWNAGCWTCALARRTLVQICTEESGENIRRQRLTIDIEVRADEKAERLQLVLDCRREQTYM